MINSVIVTINQLLPLAIIGVFAIYFVDKKIQGKQWGALAFFVTVPTVAYIAALEQLSQGFNYLGFEYSQILLIVLLTLSAGGLAFFRNFIAMLALFACATCLYLSHYVPWLMQLQLNTSVLLGIGLGVGIVLSMTVLLVFLLAWLAQWLNGWLCVALFALHVSGQFITSLDIAAGAGLITLPQPLFDGRQWLDEHSPIGRLLKILIGYEAMPSILSVCVYLGAGALLLLAAYWQRRRNHALP
ncbi:hypothetical protein ABMY44_01685 [Pseudoalteromonas sp. Cnat2-41]|uniref:hypothetical protein n=1 Tax=unclassified Pseudoalteromonas TaxID=194690 RepID=UPI001EF78E01|nr:MULTISPECIES: hypothetical protein [unclassified Pseudoalteromonas]MCF2860874.1 hypothetical protein [Pseudoalteromonas sp. CNAT2-18]MCG7556743.1 hypothetical protein [Pseudoalteromonas sp. CNAT2-18.1]